MLPGEGQRQGEVEVAAGGGPLVAEFARQPDGLADVRDRVVRVALEGGQPAAGPERPGSFLRPPGKDPQRLVEPAPALAEQARYPPVGVQPDGQPASAPPALDLVRRHPAAVAVAVVERVRERGRDVRVLRAQPPEPARLVVGQEMLVEVGGHGQVPVGQPVEEPRLLAGLRQLLAAELAQRVEQPVPVRAARGARAGVARRLAVARHHRLVDQADQRVDDLVGGQRGVRADLLRRRQVERTREDRQPPPQGLLGRRAQRVAPLDRGPQRLVPGGAAAAGDRQHAESGVEQVGQLGQRQRAQPDRGQLDGERHPVESSAQPDHVRAVGGGDREARRRRGRALREQLDRVASRSAAAPPGRRARPARRTAACWSRAR